MSTPRLDSAMRTVLEVIHSRHNSTDDPVALIPRWLDAFHPVLPFCSSVFMPIDPTSGKFGHGLVHDCSEREQGMCDYLANYQRMDPYAILQPALANPGMAIRLSDRAEGSPTLRGEFGRVRNRSTNVHALAVVPQLRGVPLGAFSIHRRRVRWPRNFNAREMQLFQWFVGHAAVAIDYLTLQRRLNSGKPQLIVVVTIDGRIEALSPEAQSLLEALPANSACTLPGPAESARIWRYGSDAIVVRTRRIDPASIVGLANGTTPSAECGFGHLTGRLRVALEERRAKFAVTFEKLDVNCAVQGDVFGIDLAPQQKRVAILLLKNYEPRQIADILRLSPHTVREYVKAICRRAGVHSYEELLSRLCGDSRTAGNLSAV